MTTKEQVIAAMSGNVLSTAQIAQKLGLDPGLGPEIWRIAGIVDRLDSESVVGVAEDKTSSAREREFVSLHAYKYYLSYETNELIEKGLLAEKSNLCETKHLKDFL